MPIGASGYFNGDDCFLAWSMEARPDCWGFALYRDLKRKDGTTATGFLHNRTGFDGDNNPPHSHRPSNEWPFQRYTWTDHGVDEGDQVSYWIAPVFKENGQLRVHENEKVTIGPITAVAQGNGKVWAYFNRGLLLSQFMAKQLGDNFNKSDLVKLKNELAKDDSELRKFLSGQLGSHLLELLEQAKSEGWHIYAALYELADDALISRLAALKKKAHLVLSNGSEKKKGKDGNKHANDELDGVIDLTRRMLWSKGLGHNKFVVFAKTAAEPFMVWTGSTNWASTGLCTQMNNGILIKDARIARIYLDQYKLLKSDQAQFGPALLSSNDEAKNGTSASGKWTVCFTRTSDSSDLEELTGLVNGAREGILFLMFEPGSAGVLQAVQARLSPASPTFDDKLYIHGVANTVKSDGNTAAVNLVSRGESQSFDLKIIEPEGIGESLAGWAAEVTRRDFIMGQGGVIGHAIVHSKVLVIDPFSNPIVVTGSHNFSVSASTKNDENFVVIRGNTQLAQRYAVNIMAVYQHYRWRNYLRQCAEKGIDPWQGLKKSDKWQASKPTDSRIRELTFWVRATAMAAGGGG